VIRIKFKKNRSLAGSVLHTFLHTFGAETWRKGLNYYLINRFNKFANSDHLYEGLQRAVNEDSPSSPVNVGMVMRSWELQSGFPLISVSRNASHVTINQERFFYIDYESQNLWHVPISYYTASTPDFTKTTPDLWSNTRSFSWSIDLFPKIKQEDDWIILNTQQVRILSIIFHFIY
jgi:aminopeptidase N